MKKIYSIEWDEKIHGEDMGAFIDSLMKAFNTGSSKVTELPQQQKEGEWCNCEYPECDGLSMSPWCIKCNRKIRTVDVIPYIKKPMS